MISASSTEVICMYLPINTSTSLQKRQVIGQILMPEQIFVLYFENRNALEQLIRIVKCYNV